MSEKRCAYCKSWNSRIHPDFGWCEAEKMQTRLEFGCIFWTEKEPDLREQLAEYAHERWSGWMEYLFDKSPINPVGAATIPIERVERWWRLMRTDYANLREEEKESDRDEADRMIAIFEKWQQKGK